ncbi:hypothetical protein DIPPA_22395 [Diplonema papillatum]|nr:hypothetical protein DIPPA_22395 [Diplonema papillatum]
MQQKLLEARHGARSVQEDGTPRDAGDRAAESLNYDFVDLNAGLISGGERADDDKGESAYLESEGGIPGIEIQAASELRDDEWSRLGEDEPVPDDDWSEPNSHEARFAEKQGRRDSGHWMCFDCHFRENSREDARCRACGKPRNVPRPSANTAREPPTDASSLPASAEPRGPEPNARYDPSGSDSHPDAFQAAALHLHAHYREKHGARPLAYSAELAASAQRHAVKCAQKLALAPWGGVGQNSFAAAVPPEWGAKAILRSAVERWYGEKSAYEEVPGLPGLQRAANYAQLVWAGTTHMGAGIAWSGTRVYVIVNYWPKSKTESDATVLRNVRSA